jgi:adenosylmethionine-8-amino-7-oxononanoate aminotransferase
MNKMSWPYTAGAFPTICRTEGLYLFDEANRPILDAAGGAVVTNIGHGRQRVANALGRAAEATSYVVPPFVTPSRQALVDTLAADWLSPTLTRAHFTSGGTEANEAAMKLALQYQQGIGEVQRTKLIGRSISYHGTTLATAAISGHPTRKRGLEQALPSYLSVPAPYPLRAPSGVNSVSLGQYYVDQMRDVILAEGPRTIAGFIAEPITGSSGGAIVPPDDYWPKVRALCDEFGLILILDEVMTGFGRTGTPFGYQHWPIEPDILVSGKGLAGGYAPLGGVFTNERVGAVIQENGFQVMFNTFGAHPAACAAAVEVLNILKEEGLVAEAAQKGAYLHAQLHAAFDQHPHVAEVRGRGLLAAIEVVADRSDLTQFDPALGMTSAIVNEGLERGVFYYAGGTGVVRDVVCLGPAFIVTTDQIDEMVSTLVASVDAAIAKLP